jgi:hypothetical protein
MQIMCSEYCLTDLKGPYKCAVIILQCQERGCEVCAGFRTSERAAKRRKRKRNK